jgi:hypothetical protein
MLGCDRRLGAECLKIGYKNDPGASPGGLLGRIDMTQISSTYRTIGLYAMLLLGTLRL